MNTTSTAEGDYRSLLQTPTLAALGPGPRPGVQSVEALSARLSQLTRKHCQGTREADLLRALTLLWHDHLDAAHEIAQGIDDRDGALVHSMMHRREPDYWNSKYWFRRVGRHPAFAALALNSKRCLKEASREDQASKLIPAGVWDPCAFVDACQEAEPLPSSDPLLALLVKVQSLEFEAVMGCFLGLC